MQELKWMESHVGSIEDAIHLINRFQWNLAIRKINDFWVVTGGEAVIFRADNYAAVEAFLYGMALACAVIPETTIEKLVEEIHS
jgi:hypothetical protein